LVPCSGGWKVHIHYMLDGPGYKEAEKHFIDNKN